VCIVVVEKEEILLLSECEGVPAGTIGELLHSNEDVAWVKFGVCRVLALGQQQRFIRLNCSANPPPETGCWHLECLLCGHTEQWMGRMERHYASCHNLNHKFFQEETIRLNVNSQADFVLISKHGNQPVFLAQRVNQLCQKPNEKTKLTRRDMGGVCA
jgi:hypothetical protein